MVLRYEPLIVAKGLDTAGLRTDLVIRAGLREYSCPADGQEAAMHRIALVSFVSVLCLVIAACGASGGGAGGSGGATATDDGPGRRAVPGYTLSAAKRSAATAGAPLTVRVTIAPEAGSQAITGVQVWLGANEYAEPASTASAAPVAGLANTWDITTTLPSPLPEEATLWLRLTTADGSVIEVGRDAFQIATLPTG